MQNPDIITQHLIVSGKVQGVGFRIFSQNLALSLKISGWVRNLADGNVEIIIQTDLKTSNKFKIQIESGPESSIINDIKIKTIHSNQLYKSFIIKENGENIWGENS